VKFVYIYYYIYIVRRALSHFQLLFYKFLLHSLIQNYLPTSEKTRTAVHVPAQWQQQGRSPLVDLPIQ